MSRPLLLILLLAVALKAMLTFGIVKSFRLSWDEESAWTVAGNKNQGHDYSLYNAEKNEYRKTAFHGSFTVILYDFFIRHDISKNTWMIFLYIATFISFILSVYYFYRITGSCLENKTLQLLCTTTYAFYPSVQYYIGALLLYENIAASLLIIFMYCLIRARRDGFKPIHYMVLPLIVSASCLFRPQLIVIYTLILFLYLVVAGNRKPFIAIMLLSFALTFAGFMPTLQKNKKLFGSCMLGTQRSFELLQGHNPVARGSWMHHWEDKGNPLYEYVHSEIINLDSLNENEEANARRKLAVSWAVQNPGKEFILTLRKAAIYFLPANFEELPACWLLNLITLLVHLFFLCGTIYLAWNRSLRKELLSLYFPVIASFLLTLIFYVGYRWRFYAEPFMILITWVFIDRLIRKKDKKTV
jgi:hypothetical protein